MYFKQIVMLFEVNEQKANGPFGHRNGCMETLAGSDSPFSERGKQRIATGPIHIAVCICTYKRPQLLKRLLQELRLQETEGHFEWSVVVADNDESRSAEQVASEFAQTSGITVTYCMESRRGISLTRNKAVNNTAGDFIAFIDDDELPGCCWLHNLLKT